MQDNNQSFTDKEIEALTNPEGTEIVISDPPQKTPEEIAAEQAAAAAAAGAKTPEQLAAEKAAADAAAVAAGGSQADGQAPAHLMPFQLLEQAYGIKVKPEEITPENAAAALVQTVVSNYDFSEIFDPKVLQLQQQIAQGKPFEEAIKAFRTVDELVTGNPDELLAQFYEETLGMTPEETAEEIKQLGNKNIEVRKAKLYFQNKARLEEEQNQMLSSQREAENWKSHIASVEQDVDKILTVFDKFDDIWGVKLSKADKDDFKPAFKKLMVPPADQPGQPALLHQLLDNDDTLLKVAYMLVKGQHLTNELLSKPEHVRQLIEGKLFSDPGIKQTTHRTDMEMDDETMLRRLREPEGLIHQS